MYSRVTCAVTSTTGNCKHGRGGVNCYYSAAAHCGLATCNAVCRNYSVSACCSLPSEADSGACTNHNGARGHAANIQLIPDTCICCIQTYSYASSTCAEAAAACHS